MGKDAHEDYHAREIIGAARKKFLKYIKFYPEPPRPYFEFAADANNAKGWEDLEVIQTQNNLVDFLKLHNINVKFDDKGKITASGYDYDIEAVILKRLTACKFCVRIYLL